MGHQTTTRASVPQAAKSHSALVIFTIGSPGGSATIETSRHAVPGAMDKNKDNAMAYFPNVEKVRYAGPDSTSPLAFRHYDAGRPPSSGKIAPGPGDFHNRQPGWRRYHQGKPARRAGCAR